MSDALQCYWDLSNADPSVRTNASERLLTHLKSESAKWNQSTPDSVCSEVTYALKRLIKGLMSSNECARQGFAVALVEVLRNFEEITNEIYLETCGRLIQVVGPSSMQEKRDFEYAKVFSLLVLMRAGRWNLLNVELVVKLLTEILAFANKNWMREFIYESIGMLIKESTKATKQDPIMKEFLKKLLDGVDITQITPEQIGLYLDLEEHYKLLGVKFPINLSLFGEDDIPSLVLPLKESIICHPRIHTVWSRVLHHTLSLPIFESFWSLVVDNGLLNGSPKHKYLVFQLISMLLPKVNSQQVKTLFSANCVRTIINHSSSAKHQLHVCVNQLLDQIVKDTQSKERNSLGGSLALHLLQIDRSFDSHTKTQTVKSLLGLLDEEGIQSYINYLKNKFESGTVVLPDGDHDDIESLKTKLVNSQQSWSVEQLCALCKNGKLPRKESWVLDVLQFIFRYAFFVPAEKKSKKSPNLISISSTVRDSCSSLFFSILSDLVNCAPFGTSSTEGKRDTSLNGLLSDGNSWSHHIHSYWSSLNLSLAVQLSPEAIDKRAKMLTTTSALNKLRIKSKDPAYVNQCRAFELMFHHISLLQLAPSFGNEANDILDELQQCYVDAFSKSKKQVKDSDSPDFINVLIDVMLSLLAKPSNLLRDVVKTVFAAFSDSLTEEALSDLMRVLTAKEMRDDDDEDGIPFGVEDMDADDDMNSETDDGAMEALNKVLEEEESDDSKSSQENDVAESELSGEESEDVDLFSADLDANELEKYDNKLAQIIQLRKKQRTATKDLNTQSLHFKLRVVDLLEIFIKRQGNHPLLITLFLPLVEAIRNNQSQDKLALHSRLTSLYQKLVSNKEILQIDSDTIKNVMTEQFTAISKGKSTQSISLFRDGLFALMRSFLSSKNVNLNDNVLFLQGLIDKIALFPYLQHKIKHLSANFFTEMFSRFSSTLGEIFFPIVIANVVKSKTLFLSMDCMIILESLLQQRKNISKFPELLRENSQSFLDGCLYILKHEHIANTKVQRVRELLKIINEFVKSMFVAEIACNEASLNEMRTVLEDFAQLDRFSSVKSNISVVISNLEKLSELKVTKTKSLNQNKRKEKDLDVVATKKSKTKQMK